ncbi:MAG: lipopolysaccharide heptosyltransferase II [Planctomycetota bacterium]
MSTTLGGPPPRRIFVRGPNWVGDLVMATPALARLRAGFAEAHITVGVRPYLKPLLSGSPFFDELLEQPRAKRLAEVRDQARQLRERRFDLAVVLPNSLQTGLVVRLAGIPRRLGYLQGRPFTMTHGLRAERNRGLLGRHGPRRVPKPMPHYYADLLDLLDIPAVADRPQLHVSAAEDEYVDRWMRERCVPAESPLLLLNPGASFGASKLWLGDRFAAVARYFRDHHGMVPVFLAGPAEVDLVRGMARDAEALDTTDPVLPLSYLKALVRRGRLLVTTDTGPRHIAVAFQVPVVCVMGPTDPRYTNYCLDETILVRKELECSPCHRKVCPLGHHECMQGLGVDEVVAAGDELLARAPGAP